jgi:hypothetical protein
MVTWLNIEISIPWIRSATSSWCDLTSPTARFSRVMKSPGAVLDDYGPQAFELGLMDPLLPTGETLDEAGICGAINVMRLGLAPRWRISTLYLRAMPDKVHSDFHCCPICDGKGRGAEPAAIPSEAVRTVRRPRDRAAAEARAAAQPLGHGRTPSGNKEASPVKRPSLSFTI